MVFELAFDKLDRETLLLESGHETEIALLKDYLDILAYHECYPIGALIVSVKFEFGPLKVVIISNHQLSNRGEFAKQIESELAVTLTKLILDIVDEQDSCSYSNLIA